MNKHLETLVGFKKGSTKVFKDQFYELWDAWDDLVSAFKKIGMALFVLVIWIFSLLLICILPLATWLRLRWEKEREEQYQKEVARIKKGYNPVKRGGHENTN